MKKIQFLLLSFFACYNLCAQNFGLITRYSHQDSSNVQIDVPNFVPKDSAFMQSFSGKNSIILKTTPDSLDDFSNFSPLVKASILYPTDKYPLSAVIKINSGSGIIVHERFILSAKHVCGKFAQCSIIPAFDNGVAHPVFGTLTSKAIYNFGGSNLTDYYDISLIELEEPIGQKTGWIGIGYNSNIDQFDEKVFYSFGYPNYDHHDPGNGRFNGDTMFHFFGNIDGNSGLPPIQSLRVKAEHYSGQSGSGYFVAYDGVNVNYGILHSHGRFLLISDSVFSAYKYIIDSVNNHYGLISSLEFPKVNSFKLYPNPATKEVFITIEAKANAPIYAKVYDLTGRVVLRKQYTNTYPTQVLDVNELKNGVYILELKLEDNILRKKFIKISNH